MTSSYWKTSVFVRPHVNEKPAFEKIATLKDAFSVAAFTEYIRVDGRTNRKKISVNSKCGQGLGGAILAPVVQKVDNAIHLINLYPLDSAIGFPNTYPLDSDLSSG